MKPNRRDLRDSDSRFRSIVVRFVLLIGVLSFSADFTYEGSRSIVGPYLKSVGASAASVAIVAGLGELLGYGLRVASGRWADSTTRFWPIMILGYVIQMTAVPALALTQSWPTAAALVVLERVGKAIRNPPRDVLLSHAAKHVGGYGRVFGLHEALDQLGATFGPLLVAVALCAHGSFRTAFAFLAVPALLNLTIVAVARLLYPNPEIFEPPRPRSAIPKFPGVFWLYLSAAALIAAGFVDYRLIAYHFSVARRVPTEWIPIFYACAMAASGTGSLLFGRLFDRYGFKVLPPLTICAALFAPLVFLGGFWSAIIGVVVWGVGTGVHESIIPAAVAPIVPLGRRAFAYRLFTTCYGVSWFLGSVVIGFLYERSLDLTIVFCVATQLLAVPFLGVIAHLRTKTPG